MLGSFGSLNDHEARRVYRQRLNMIMEPERVYRQRLNMIMRIGRVYRQEVEHDHGAGKVNFCLGSI
jgi:hypothetical protein